MEPSRRPLETTLKFYVNLNEQGAATDFRDVKAPPPPSLEEIIADYGSTK